MSDISENPSLNDPFDIPSSEIMIEESDLTSIDSINRTIEDLNSDLQLSSETIRLLFIAIAIITILICLAICLSVCICICLNRRRNFIHQNKKDQQLLPEQSEKIDTTNYSTAISIPKKLSNSTNIVQSSSANLVFTKPPLKSPTYYDNLDDIPFIDESRPTSFIDVTRV